ncbi:MAG: minichromosome maintenance protein MCM [Candidatus Woesearchaeota archaeon]
MALDAAEQIERFQEFIESHYNKELHSSISKGESAIVMDFFDLSKFDPSLAEQLLEEPLDTVKAAELAIQQMDIESSLRVRFRNLPVSQKVGIRNLRSIHLGKFITIEGIIRQASNVRPEVVAAKFECPSCASTITLQQTESKFREPSRCSCGRKGKFRLLAKELVDAQRLVVEEAPQSLDGGAEPKRMPIFLREDLVDPKFERRTTPGKYIRIVGVMKEIPIPSKDGGMKTIFELVINSNHIELVETDFSDIETNEEEEKEIKEIAKSRDIYRKLSASIAPSIYGHEIIKEALALQMFGGVKKVKKDGTATRGDMHFLLVGDPGCGKSQLLTFIKIAAPKARYVAGKGASSAGITASVVKDEFTRGWALEAGAMVLADRGILLIDEMDKMAKEDTSALHEAMEQQQITIAKANIQATLRAETTVLAAANPKLGRFDPYESIAKQIDLPAALINRFDLIFIVRDIPDKALDHKIATQVLKNQSYRDVEPEISSDMLRKYVAYAKQRVNPVLTEEAMKQILDFYVSLRNSGKETDGMKSIPISPRQLEALVRLSEASARVRLSDKVKKEDALRAIRLLKTTLHEVGIDPATGEIDIDRITTGITTSERRRYITVREIIFKMDQAGKKTIPIEDIVKEAAAKGIPETVVEEAVEKFKRSGDIFEPKRGHIQKI